MSTPEDLQVTLERLRWWIAHAGDAFPTNAARDRDLIEKLSTPPVANPSRMAARDLDDEIRWLEAQLADAQTRRRAKSRPAAHPREGVTPACICPFPRTECPECEVMCDACHEASSPGSRADEGPACSMCDHPETWHEADPDTGKWPRECSPPDCSLCPCFEYVAPAPPPPPPGERRRPAIGDTVELAYFAAGGPICMETRFGSNGAALRAYDLPAATWRPGEVARVGEVGFTATAGTQHAVSDEGVTWRWPEAEKKGGG